jgi:DNA-binding NtrC family response regulator
MKTYKPTQILISANAQDGLSEILADALMTAGFNSKIVGRHENLLLELRAGYYSVVILTNNALRPNEFAEFIPNIKKINPNIKIIVLSGWNQENLAERVLACGAAYFFPLPIGLDILTNCIKDLTRLV